MPLPDIDVDSYTEPLVGSRLPATTLRGVLDSEKMVILHFLRHLGCIYCKHSVDQLYKVKQQSAKFPTIYFVHQSTIQSAEDFFAERFPGAPHMSNPSLDLYRLYGIERLNPMQFLNPLQISVGVKSLLSGNVQTAPEGDVWVLSGTFLYNNGRLVWCHRAQFAGDDPQWDKFLR